METMLSIANIAGGIASVLGLFWAIYAHRQNEGIKRLIIGEKDLFRDRVLDFYQILKSQRDQVLADRTKDPALNKISIRIEEIEGMMATLERFAERLEKIK
jgi:hypothetical protein